MSRKKLRIVGACDHNRVIGQNGKLPLHLEEELAHFKSITTGSSCVVGRKTFENIINIEDSDREFIVLTTTTNYDGVKTATSIREAIQKTSMDEVNFIGGANVFEFGLPHISEIKLSIIHDVYKGDRYFPILNRKLWKVDNVEDVELDDTSFSVYTIVRNTLNFRENFSSKFAVPEFIRLDNIRS